MINDTLQLVILLCKVIKLVYYNMLCLNFVPSVCWKYLLTLICHNVLTFLFVLRNFYDTFYHNIFHDIFLYIFKIQ